MIAYDRDKLDALETREKAGQWQQKGLLTDDQWQEVQKANDPRFYTPNRFVRIGLAVFCFILMLAAMGLIGIFADPDTETGLALFGLFWGVVWILILEHWAIRSARHFGSGIDDMLLYVAATVVVASLCNLLPYNTDILVSYLIAWPVLVLGAIRYRDRVMAAAAFICSLVILFRIVENIPQVAPYLMPLAGLVFSAAAYRFSRQAEQRRDWRFWYDVLVVVELLALVAFYASGNYWVVQQAGEGLFGLPVPPLGWFFWIFTFTVPALYLYLGITRKDRLLLDVGMLCTGAAVFTFRYYFHVLPWAWAAAIAGAVLFLGAYFSIRYLRSHSGAYTYETDGDTTLLQEAEEQLIEQTIATQTPPERTRTDTFDGGQFGGGGAGGEF